MDLTQISAIFAMGSKVIARTVIRIKTLSLCSVCTYTLTGANNRSDMPLNPTPLQLRQAHIALLSWPMCDDVITNVHEIKPQCCKKSVIYFCY